MALSEQEQRLLDEMERHLYQNEADVMSTTPRSNAPISTRTIVLAILAVAVGLGVVLAGLALQLPIVGIVGFIVMLVGVLFAFRSRQGDDSAMIMDAPSSAPEGKGARASGGFMDRLEGRWDRRRNGD